MKTKSVLIPIAILLSVFYYFLIINPAADANFNSAKREILMRKIGDEILLHSGDRSSRVMPVKKLSDDEYQLQFEKQFTFEPDALVNIIRNVLSNNEKHDYIVNVLKCDGSEVIYGYSVSKETKNDVIPCRGRVQPKACYVVNIKLRETASGFKKYDFALAALGIGLLSILILSCRKKKILLQKHTSLNAFQIGTVCFDPEKKCLITASETINLTHKENKLLLIFAQNPNQIIERTRLQKEIWEDDGIIVGRSLDVFISKLRKKLESDAAVQLINVHGKGYKLQIDTAKT